MWPSSWLLARLKALQNNGSKMFMSNVKPCQLEIATDESKKTTIIESAEI